MMASSVNLSAIQTVAAAFRLAMPRAPIGGRLGSRLGSGVGSSLEFQDYREYVAGDDPRHVDWAAYARSDVLTVRLYREEVAPRIDFILDDSRSMAVTEAKAKSYRNLAALLAELCLQSEADTRLILSGATEPRRLSERIEMMPDILTCNARASALEEAHLPLRRRSMRLVVSDFLFRHDADALVGKLARDGASLSIIQLTLAEEAEPTLTGAHRLVDAEGNGELDLVVDQDAVRAYRERFHRLRLGLSRASRRVGANFAHLTAETSLQQMAKTLAVTAILEVA